MHRVTALAALLLVLPMAPEVAADQDDPRLDTLFAELRSTESGTAVRRLTAEIWAVWLSHDSERVRRAMEEARSALRASRLAQAEARLDRLVEQAPGYAEGWNQRATVRYLRGRYAESAADIRRVLALEPRHFGALEGLGLIYLELGLDDAALSAFERALAVNPHLPAAREHVRMLRGGGAAGAS